MSRFTIFRTPKPQQYRYIPRYYDPDKAELKARVDAAKVDVEKDRSPEAVKARIRAGFKSSRYSIDRKFQRKARRKSSYRVAIIAIALTLVIFYLIKNNLHVIDQFMR